MAANTVERRGEALVRAALVLSSELSLQAVLQRIVELAVEVTRARYGALGVLNPEGTITQFVTVGMSEEQRRAIGHYPVGRGILGVLIDEATPLRLHRISDHPRSVGFPANHPPMRTFLGAPVESRGRVFGNLYLTEKRGDGDFDADDEEALVVLARQAGVAIANARLYEQARSRERRLEAVREITTAILEGADAEPVVQLVADRARELAGADLATIAVPTDGNRLRVVVASGRLESELRGTEFERAGSISDAVMAAVEPVVVDDASTDGRVKQPVLGGGDIGPAMFVPLAAAGRAFGTIAVGNGVGGRSFSDEDLDTVVTFAGQAAVALEYARARRDVERLAVLEDRERIAKELHDGVIQALFAVGMGLQGAAALSRDDDLERRIESAVADIDRVIRDLRNYIFGLRPGILADRELDDALKRLVAEFDERTGIVTVADIDAEVAQELASNAADIVQLTREALSNVGRHSGAATCRVTLRRDGREAVLEIDDDGHGFEPATIQGAGQGMPNLNARAASLGGRIEIDSDSESGTTVRARIPL